MQELTASERHLGALREDARLLVAEDTVRRPATILGGVRAC